MSALSDKEGRMNDGTNLGPTRASWSNERHYGLSGRFVGLDLVELAWCGG